MSKYISGIANRNNIDDWSARAEANSFHNSDTNKGAANPTNRSKVILGSWQGTGAAIAALLWAIPVLSKTVVLRATTKPGIINTHMG